jgi:hypothetical protein
MRKLVILASVAILAASSVNCANSSQDVTSLVSPSAVSADAKKPGHGNDDSSTLAIAMVYDAKRIGAPDYGDTITFNVSTTATTAPRVSLACSQSGNVVMSAMWPATPNITLSSGLWHGGAADCTATLFAYVSGTKQNVLKTLDFNVGE